MNFLEKLKPHLIENDLDALLITSESSRYYATKFYSSDGLVLALKEQGFNIVDFRYIENAREQCKDFSVVLQEKGAICELKRLCNENNILRLGFDENSVTVKEYSVFNKELEGAQLVPCGNIISKLRQVKEPYEIEFIKKAQSITDKAFSHILNYIKVGVSETDIVAQLEYFMTKNGANGFSFPTKVLSAVKTSFPHGQPDNTKFKQNIFIMMDFGAKYNGLCSDMTRTVALGQPTAKMKRIYDIVLKAQNKALQGIKANMTGIEIDRLARDIIEKEGYSKNFGHSLGHSVGYLVHEEPKFSPLYKDIIPQNAVLSVEPGIYIEKEFGVRIEDLVLVTQDGCDNLTKSKKELIIL